MAAVTDRIEKRVLLRAPRSRVWRAIADAAEFGSWFGMKVGGAFAPGARLQAEIVPTRVDPDVARQQEPHTGMAFDILVERVEPERILSFRWHPFAIDRNADYSHEPTTLVVFTLDDAENGTWLTLTESGFDQIPLDRRAQAFSSNDQGWSIQMTLIDKYLRMHAG